jgi:hypothetical protein
VGCWSLGRGSGSGHRRADSLFLRQPSRASGVFDGVGSFARRAAGDGNAVLALVALAAASAATSWPGAGPFVVPERVAPVAASGPRDVGVHGEFDPHKRDRDVGGGVGGCESQ